MTKRKTIAMLIAVSVPAEMNVRQAKLEVRSRINDQCAYFDYIGVKRRDRMGGSSYDRIYLDEKDVRLRKIGWARSLGLGVKRLVLGHGVRFDLGGGVG